MNKKTLAIAALALFATSGLASAQTIHSPRRVQPAVSERVVVTSPYDAFNQIGDSTGNQVQAQYRAGDNDMDRYNTAEYD